MKPSFLYLLLVCALSLSCSGVHSSGGGLSSSQPGISGLSPEERFQIYEDAKEAKDYEAALEWAQGAYEGEPDRDTYAFWYGWELARAKQHSKALKIIGTVSGDYRALETTYKKATLYEALGQSDAAVDSYKHALALDDTKTHLKANIYAAFTKLIRNLRRPDMFWEYRSEAMTYFNVPSVKAKKEKTIQTFNYHAIRVLEVDLFKIVGNKKDEKALEVLRAMQEHVALGLGRYAKNIKPDEIDVVERAIRYWVKNASKRSRASNKHRLRVVFVEKMDIRKIPPYPDDTKPPEMAEVPKRISTQMEKKDITRMMGAFEFFKRMYFYFSKGQLQFEITKTRVDATIKGAYWYLYYSPRPWNRYW